MNWYKLAQQYQQLPLPVNRKEMYDYDKSQYGIWMIWSGTRLLMT